nr:ATP-binding protein [Mucilaginibacter sp. L294]
MNKDLARSGVASKSIRNLFIIFLLITFIVTTGSFILKHVIAQKLDKLSIQLVKSSHEPEIGNILLELNSAENDFQQASSNGDAEKLDLYKLKINSIFHQVDTLLKKYQADSILHSSAGKPHIARLLEQKLAESQNLFELKHRFDSLLNVTNIDNISATHRNKPAITAKQKGNKATVDTTVSTRREVNKSGMIRRIRDAITNKNLVKVITVHEKQNKDSIASSLIKNNKYALQKVLKQLKLQNSYILHTNEQLITANLSLLAQLHRLLQQLKDNELMAKENSRNEILRQYRSTTNDMDSFIGVTIVLILLFIILLIVYIRKVTEAEQNYLTENERAVTLAGQKSELLAIMSHEIRNKLMGITGAVYMLNKTHLSPDQEKKTASINLSTTMLLETLNNTLDISKLEHGQSEVLIKIAFNPFKAIMDAMESMQFMAERKGILLTAEFAGNEEILVSGDALKLKQIMLNLLSNAIKYTDEGSVKVMVSVDTGNEQQLIMKVKIKDTGIGIPKKQQSQLFTRYYQANSNHGKPGTGLGLYLCKQLIELQGGSIQVESEVQKGCTMQFSIPYNR